MIIILLAAVFGVSIGALAYTLGFMLGNLRINQHGLAQCSSRQILSRLGLWLARKYNDFEQKQEQSKLDKIAALPPAKRTPEALQQAEYGMTSNPWKMVVCGFCRSMHLANTSYLALLVCLDFTSVIEALLFWLVLSMFAVLTHTLINK